MKIGIIADIHEDIKRLEETFQILKQEKCSQIVCLGDLVGIAVPFYGFLKSRNAHAVVEMIKKNCDITVIGNHDLFAIRKLPKNKAGFNYPKNWYSLDYFERQKLSKDKIHLYEHNELTAILTKEDKKFLGQLPEYVVKQYGDLKILFSHYAFPDLVGARRYDPKTQKDIKEHFKFMEKHNCMLSISGHYHTRKGMVMFTEKEVHEITFNKNTKLTNNLTWIYGPMVANSTFDNGVLILDTDKKEIKALPLKTKKITVNKQIF